MDVSESLPQRDGYHHATVAVYGDPGSGKKTLLSILNKRPYKRETDGKVFTFNAQLGTEYSTRVSIAIVLYNAVHRPAAFEETLQLARKESGFTCVVQTKFDLVTSDYSNEHLSHLQFAPRVAYKYDVDCINVSLTTSNGVSELLSLLMNYLDPPSAPKATSLGLLQRLRDALLDRIAALFALPTRCMTSDISSELSQITSDEDLYNRLRTEFDMAWGDRLKQRLHAEASPWSVGVHRITHSLVAKRRVPSERASMEYVRQNTSIPIPRTYLPNISMLVMDFIDGDMLHECWNKLGLFRRFRIACTLRVYVNQMRTLRRPAVGAVDTGYMGGILFGDSRHGPFESLSRFRRFCEYVACVGWRPLVALARIRGEKPPPMPRPSLDWTPVFTHGDLNPSNVLIDRQGTVWIIDWDSAGFYPSCIESVAMWHVDVNIHPDDDAISWHGYRWFIAGKTTEEEEQFWYNFFSGIHRFRGIPKV
ncbi:hypothetical protein L226DRAFT_478029 [Lentinus tigrinus ALCF2SS1-7]|uniref:Aminoglycoside phosphotransferase domain-containing protein n=1 Tax=Lentinus tigrinus ALCF2SS1-6 TaxID=1328759 RepID=A0A5C2SUE2_9APHY|nr:hypothetical protein L227DRAFT_597170 [Lentinus tigrinus ALCF2SS1-6]RPD81443.1 hypothetical protein L226DRAFT_478029 [Lentinus tigrinus ALCF2SS1-7]